MTETEHAKPRERLYKSIASLPGWYYLLDRAEESAGRASGARLAGSAISAVLLAAGEEAVPLAVTGKLDDTYSGRLLVFYDGLIVDVTAVKLRTDSGSIETRVRFPSRATNLRVETRHSHYYGTDEYPRHQGFQFSFSLDGEQIVLTATNWTPNAYALVQDAAVYSAYTSIRDRLIEQ